MTEQTMVFSSAELQIGSSIKEVYDTRDIPHTPGLFRASVKDALMYGGELTRAALSIAPIVGDKKYIIVDTKVHMLMPGMYPAIPGWHTDAAPRATAQNGQKQAPDLFKQRRLTDDGQTIRFHLLVTGSSAQTEFVDEPIYLAVKDRDPELYKNMTNEVNVMLKHDIKTRMAPSDTWTTWDWWTLHRATAATAFEWRYLIRITESNTQTANTDLRKVLRQHSQVYTPLEFGW